MARSYYQALSCAATRKCALKAPLRFALSDGWRHVGRILRAEYGEDFHNSGPIGMARQTGDWRLEVSERTGDIQINAIDLSTLPIADDLPA